MDRKPVPDTRTNAEIDDAIRAAAESLWFDPAVPAEPLAFVCIDDTGALVQHWPDGTTTLLRTSGA